jgi:DNA-binding LacI/PurR family transcriptional regulator
MAEQPGVSVGCDNVQGGRDATAHLIAQRRKRIAFIGGADEHCPEFRDRYDGYVEALNAAGLRVNDALQIDAITTEQAGYDALCTLLNRGEKFDAVFAASDLIAIGAMRALLEKGFSIPRDVAVAGFDDIPLASFVNPPLTTVLQDTKRAGEMLVETLIKQIQHQPVESCKIPAKLIVRKSAGE